MKNKTKLAVALAVGLACVLGASSTSLASPSPTVSPSVSPAAGWYAVASLTGAKFTPSNQKIAENAGAKLLGFVDWVACWQIHNEGWVIKSFSTIYLAAKRVMSIQCGTAETHGYFHIALPETGRQKQWRDRLTQAQPSANTDGWDDFMWALAIETWTTPEVSLDQGNGKVCRSAPIQMFGPNATGQIVLKYTFHPSFIWSVTQNRLITAIPSTTPTC